MVSTSTFLVLLAAVIANVTGTIQNVTVPAPHRFSPVLAEHTTRSSTYDTFSPSPPLEGSIAGLVQDALGTNTEASTRSGLAFLQTLYEPHSWSMHGPALNTPLQAACRRHLAQYIQALHNGTAWAVKMTDASGRYTSQFFFGNDFWLGSLSLCNELQSRYSTSPPPFSISFHVTKIAVELHSSLTPKTRVISLGTCLPRSCGKEDLNRVLQETTASAVTAASSGVSANETRLLVRVLRVRPVPGEYSLLSDSKLHILGGVSAVVLLLMAAAAGYELLIRADRFDDANYAIGNDNCGDGAERAQQNGKAHNNNNSKTVPSYGSSGIAAQILLAFSPLSNGRKILCCSASGEDSLTAVHGLRFLSLAWVILVHTYLQVFAIAENKTLRTVTERNFLFQTVSNATFSVDTFFFISGLLVAFLYFKSTARKTRAVAPMVTPTTLPRTLPLTDKTTLPAVTPTHNGSVNGTGNGLSNGVENKRPRKSSSAQQGILRFGTLLGYRFVRLTPAYLFVLGMVEISMRWIHNNSVFEPLILDQLNCDRYWWRNALYINSLFPRKDMCMLWSWYMSNDTQFYILGIGLLLLSARYFRAVAGSLIFLMVSSWITTAAVSVHFQYQARIQEPFDRFDELYDKPWTRLGPYLVGVITGWILFRTNCKIKMSKTVVLVGWTLSLACLGSLVYGLLHTQLGIAVSAAYVGLGHTAWGVALGWIVIACCTGYGGFINTLLSFHGLYPLSRLTYCAYLVHPMIMVLTSYQMDGPLHLHNSLVLTLYFGNMVASFLLSFVISLAYEAPVVRLLKIAMPTTKSPSKPAAQINKP